MFNNKGQTLMELIVVISVSIIVIGGLVFAIISSLRNAQFSKNQSQATKLAQEGIERVRTGRDRDRPISVFGVDTVSSWNGTEPIWDYQISISGGCEDSNLSGKCYFNVDSTGQLDGVGFASTSFPSGAEGIPSDSPIFRRVVTLSDNSTTYGSQKTVTVIVRWTDFSGAHESRLTTILRKI